MPQTVTLDIQGVEHEGKTNVPKYRCYTIPYIKIVTLITS